jgi:Holliday junction resolvase RusA-like endonuclease
VIPGVPIPQGRMRLSKWGVFDPVSKEKKVIKEQITEYVKRFYINEDMFEHPRVSFLFQFPIPKSAPKKKMKYYLSGLLKHEKKPDTDNLVKLYLDCLDGIVFTGDQSVQLGPCYKTYHQDPKTIISVIETNALVSQGEIDNQLYTLLCEPLKSAKSTFYEMDCPIYF